MRALKAKRQSANTSVKYNSSTTSKHDLSTDTVETPSCIVRIDNARMSTRMFGQER
jgi:hypothetical protein